VTPQAPTPPVAEVEAVPTPVQRPVEPVQPVQAAQPTQPIQQTIPEPQIIHRTVVEAPELSETARLIMSYHNIAMIDSTLTSFMLGLNANLVGDFENAVRFLRQVPSTDINYEQALRLLYDSYLSVGDIGNASFYASLLASLEEPEAVDFINMPVQMWMALIAAGFMFIVGGTIAFISRGAKKSKKKEVSDKDLDVHRRNLQRAYEQKNMYSPEPPLPKATSSPQKETIIGDDYNNPPILAEEIDEEEEQELIRAERPSKPAPAPTNKPPVEDQFADEEEPASYIDDEYRKNLVLKLYNDGWNTEEIAKELQMSRGEIDFIIKMNS
jgi:hypothetical protein